MTIFLNYIPNNFLIPKKEEGKLFQIEHPMLFIVFINQNYPLYNAFNQNQPPIIESIRQHIVNSPEIGLDNQKINFSNINVEFTNQIIENYNQIWQKIQQSPFNFTDIQELVTQRENTLRKDAPHILLEIEQWAKLLKIPYEQYLIVNLFNELNSPSDDGCTSWVSAGNANQNPEVLLHKNRDYDYDAQIVVQGNTTGKYRYHAIVTATNPTGVAAGINEYGLAVVNNLVTTTDVVASGIGNLHMNRLILEECKTVEEVSEFIDTKQLNSGVIFLVADNQKGAIFEVKASARTTLEQSLVINDVAYRANQFELLIGSGSEGSKTSLIRYNAAKAFLDARKGNLTILDSFELSRHHYFKNDQPVSKFNRPDRSISNYHPKRFDQRVGKEP
jgi:predicted choloylglycine hydrolase